MHLTHSRKFLHVILLLFALGAAIAVCAQDDKIAFERYGVEEGLPEEFVRSILQDDQGFIWISTQNGVARYDGYDFDVFRGVSADSSSGGLQLRGARRMITSSSGELWMSNWEGLASYDPKKEVFQSYLANSKDSVQLQGDNVVLFDDVFDRIWFYHYSFTTDSLFLARLDPNTGAITSYPARRELPGLSDVVLNFRVADSESDSSVWMISSTTGYLSRWNAETDTFELIVEWGDTLPGTAIVDSLTDLVKGQNGRLLTFSANGLYVWDPVKRMVEHAFTNLPGKDSTLRPGMLLGGFEDDHGYFWVISEMAKLTHIDPRSGNSRYFEFGEELSGLGISPSDVAWLCPYAQNKQEIFYGVWDNDWRTRAFLRYNHDAQDFTVFDYAFNDPANEEIFNESAFWSGFISDHSGVLWLGTRPDLYKEVPKSRQLELFTHDPEDPATIPSDSVHHIFEDDKGRVWVGTTRGLTMTAGDGKFQEVYYTNYGQQESLGNIFQIYEDGDGQIWVGTAGNGLFRFDERKKEFRQVDLSPYINNSTGASSEILFILEDNNGNLWVSIPWYGIIVLDPTTLDLIKNYDAATADRHGLTSDYLNLAYKDSRGDIWLGDRRSNDHGLFKFVPDGNRFRSYTFDSSDSASLMSNEIRFITEDDLGRIWIGTDEGVCIYNAQNDGFDRNHDQLKIPSVVGHLPAGNGRMWITTYSGGGLVLIGPGINDVEIYGEEHGLLHNDGCEEWHELLLDNNGLLWLPNRRGLSVFDTRTRSFKSYFEEDGFQSYGRRYRTLKTQNGTIWIGGLNGLNRIDPLQLAEKDSTLPKLLITGMNILDSTYSGADGKLFEQSVSYTEQVSLNHKQRDLTFEFVALHYARPADNMYSWKLENYDRGWSAPSKERKATYTNLSPGKYTFRVIGSNADGIWNEDGASIKITIRPPWWRTWWAYGLYALLFAGGLYRLHIYQKTRTEEKERKKAQERELQQAREIQKAQERELQQAREIQKAYTELKATQEQLIHSEKMASLGELTAGIAHEIQNPLNFVNNFSDVSKELLEEMLEELKNVDSEEVDAIAHDVIQNLEKIAHHGKRADSIVKGMLQHSRSSDGEKHPTDINVLADEYLRLAYHGLRAKDKTFNANLETDFDNSIGKIDVVPQDIGRVLLNLLTNAFHAVNEKKKSAPEGYQPEVMVKTRKTARGVAVEVTDNGNGIPEEVRAKIFQPFFTTKPTGQGTGLGLSMSYDIIIKGHGGELNVSSKVGVGTTFTIVLPGSKPL